ncbi:hypothetical protein E5329_08395 [Petralouisia muris]|uniref:Uncharacterized protein n=1 Tax=Petralouisia muris TaxID=3032872 RepID=A0AC61RY89_9FIRM|nr:hypothetical protein [Petralouisia muris]TGY96770.1 hypothetical protein E5329_08395 [Petralouisia muris]
MENINRSLSGSNRRSAETENFRGKEDTHPVPDWNDTAYDYLKASSATDCTGAVPRPPQDSAELDSYLDVYNFLPQCAYTQPNSVEIDMLKNKGQAKSDSF